MTEWQPIKTAPKDGTIIDVWCPEDTPERGYRVADSYWSIVDKIWRRVGGAAETTWMHEPTHWMQLPAHHRDDEQGTTMTLTEQMFRLTVLVGLFALMLANMNSGHAIVSGILGILFGTALERLLKASPRS